MGDFDGWCLQKSRVIMRKPGVISCLQVSSYKDEPTRKAEVLLAKRDEEQLLSRLAQFKQEHKHDVSGENRQKDLGIAMVLMIRGCFDEKPPLWYLRKTQVATGQADPPAQSRPASSSDISTSEPSNTLEVDYRQLLEKCEEYENLNAELMEEVQVMETNVRQVTKDMELKEKQGEILQPGHAREAGAGPAEKYDQHEAHGGPGKGACLPGSA